MILKCLNKTNQSITTVMTPDICSSEQWFGWFSIVLFHFTFIYEACVSRNYRFKCSQVWNIKFETHKQKYERITSTIYRPFGPHKKKMKQFTEILCPFRVLWIYRFGIVWKQSRKIIYANDSSVNHGLKIFSLTSKNIFRCAVGCSCYYFFSLSHSAHNPSISNK